MMVEMSHRDWTAAMRIAVLTDLDMVNIEIGIVLREILGSDQSPHGQRIPIVMRIFDRKLGDAVGHRLGFQYVRSTVDLATPWFIGAAMGLEVLGTFSVGQRSFMVGGVRVRPGSELDGVAMFELSTHTRVIAMERDGGDEVLHPHRDVRLQAGDTASGSGYRRSERPYWSMVRSRSRSQPRTHRVHAKADGAGTVASSTNRSPSSQSQGTAGTGAPRSRSTSAHSMPGVTWSTPGKMRSARSSATSR